MHRVFKATKTFFASWRFPVFTLTIILLLSSFVLTMLLVPSSQTGFGAVAAEFKIWCFGYDPATGSLDWSYILVSIVNPLLMSVFIAGVWWKPLKKGWSDHRKSFVRTGLAGVLAVAALATGLTSLGSGQTSNTELPFPAERLRTELQPPEIRLTNQHGKTIDLADYRGEVVLLTAVYTSCHMVCPKIIRQIKRARAKLSAAERDQLTVLAITLDPENDTPRRLAHWAKSQEVSAPDYQLLTGKPDTVNELLDRLNVSRKKNPDNGMIDHTNLFALVDVHGDIAYRLTLGDRHERWLTTAMSVLAREAMSTELAGVGR